MTPPSAPEWSSPPFKPSTYRQETPPATGADGIRTKDDTMEIELHEGDIFNFRYSEEYIAKSQGHDLYHCFDGQLVAVKRNDGSVMLRDTYWAFGSSDGQGDTFEGWMRCGTLVFVVNLSDIDPAEGYKADYYADSDWFDLSHQHRCYKRFGVRKGAKRNKAKMEAALCEKLRKAKQDAERAIRVVEECARKLSRLDMGDLDIYI